MHFRMQDSYECTGYYEFGALVTLLVCIIYFVVWRILCNSQNKSVFYQSIHSQQTKE